MKRAIAYYRKSIEHEAERSIDRQRAFVQDYAKENKIEIVKEYEEIASSATIDRDGLQEMYQFLSGNKEINYILVYSFDRITREVHHLGWILTQLGFIKTSAKLHSVTEDNDYDDDHIKLFMIMMKTFGSTQERVNTVNRLQSARQRKARHGGYIGGTVPMGYESQKGTAKLHIKENEVATVQKVFELREEKMTIQQIADELNKQGFRTRKNKEFKPTTVHRILKNKDMYEGKTQAPRIL